MLTTADYLIIVVYLAAVAVLGIRMAGKQASTTDYFLGGRELPWWAVCFSIVATETSTLTIIGLPAVAYGGSMVFLQLTLGYVIGRSIVALVLLPRYYEGSLVTVYEYLGQRYGDGIRATASATFLLTRLLADGVRLFATAIPLRIIAVSSGLDLTYFEILLGLGAVTVVYTYIGGIKAVVWMDVLQMTLYVSGGLVTVMLLLGDVPQDWWSTAASAGKTAFLDFGLTEDFAGLLTQPYVFVTAVVGGAVFSMASHGTDQLIVQRLLACRTLRDSQKALVGSAIAAMLQFALFLVIGLLLWSRYGGATYAELGLTRNDEIFPMYIVTELPTGLSGLLLAGIIAAAMSTLSSSLNSLSSSSMMDLWQRFGRTQLDDRDALRLSRLFTLFWGLVLVGFASLFEDTSNPVVELGLTVASFTYGALLGSFMLGFVNARSRQSDALVAFAITIVAMAWIIFAVWYSPQTGWFIKVNPTAEFVAQISAVHIGWPWYPLIGATITVISGSLLSLRHSH